MSNPQVTPTLAQSVRAKFPGQYDDMDDVTLENKVLAKYPQYGDMPKSSPAVGPDDPSGNYDFGELGKVSGMKANGKPATRQQAYRMLSGQHGIGQAIGQNVQQNRQAISNLGQSAFNTDQATKEYMGDLVATAVAGGNPDLAQMGRWNPVPFAGRNAAVQLAKKAAISKIPGASLLGAESPTLKDLANLFTANSEAPNIESNPTFFRQFGKQQHLPVNGSAPMAVPQMAPIMTPIDAANQREAGLQAQSSPNAAANLNNRPTAQPAPQQVQEQPSAQGAPQQSGNLSIDDLLNRAKASVEKKYGPAPQSPPASNPASPETPADLSAYYGKYSGKSSNFGKTGNPTPQFQRDFPEGLTPQPGPHPADIMRILQTPGEVSDQDMTTLQNYFAKKKLTDMVSGAAGGGPAAGSGIGPGTAHVSDPGFNESVALGGHADWLNDLPSEFTGETMKFHNDKLNGLYEGVDPITSQEHDTAARLLRLYQVDPVFKNLADAGRHYVHNYKAIGDIDKISLGENPIHQAGPVGYNIKGQRIEGFPIEETTLLDGTKDPRQFLTEDEGKQMVETLYGAIRNAEPRSIPLYRGIENYTYGPKSLPRLAVGDQLSLPLSSFSTNPKTAQDFGDIILKIEGPSRHLNVRPFNSYDENEHLMQGRFQVVGNERQSVEGPWGTLIEPKTGLPRTQRVITIKQVGVH